MLAMKTVRLLGVLFLVAALAWTMQDTGVPTPFGRFDLFGVIVSRRLHGYSVIVQQNLIFWACIYFPAHLALYFEPGKSYMRPYKFNPAYPPTRLVLLEMFRSARGVCINSALEAAVHRAVGTGALPLATMDMLLGPEESLLPLLLGGLCLYLWGDCHFYWTHRFLHTSFFYKRVHKIHHESFNPNGFSGLSMHWFESIVYFSSAPIVALLAPIWLARILFKGCASTFLRVYALCACTLCHPTQVDLLSACRAFGVRHLARRSELQPLYSSQQI